MNCYFMNKCTCIGNIKMRHMAYSVHAYTLFMVFMPSTVSTMIQPYMHICIHMYVPVHTRYIPPNCTGRFYIQVKMGNESLLKNPHDNLARKSGKLYYVKYII